MSASSGTGSELLLGRLLEDVVLQRVDLVVELREGGKKLSVSESTMR